MSWLQLDDAPGVVQVQLARDGQRCLDYLAVEEPLAIRVNQRDIAVVMRTPSSLEADEELAIGFLVTEGVIDHIDDVRAIEHSHDAKNPHQKNMIHVVLEMGTADRLSSLINTGRDLVAGSGCGICGKASIESVFIHHEPFAQVPSMPIELITSLPHRLRSQQVIFERTGGLHAAGVFNVDGQLICFAEDIGRHNAVDKVVGSMLRKQVNDPEQHILVVSSRAGFEIVQKAVVARIATVVAVGAASSLAHELASESGLSLYSFVRSDSANAHRVVNQSGPKGD